MIANFSRKNQDPCRVTSPCGEPCILTGSIPHTIHCCMDKHCRACHGGAEHAANMLARRREAAQREQARMREGMGGLDGPEFLGFVVEGLEY